MKKLAVVWSETRCHCNGREWNYPNSVARFVNYEIKSLSWTALDELGWDPIKGFPLVGSL